MFTIRWLDVVALLLVLAVRRGRRAPPTPTRAARTSAGAWRRGVRALRAAGLCGTGLVAFTLALPPTTCSCFGPRLRRCDNSLRYVAVLKSDLRYLSSQQEIYREEHGTYSSDAAELAFWPSDGSRIRIEATADHWSALATHDLLGEGRSCSARAPTSEGSRAEIDCSL